MDKQIGIGAIIGLITGTSLYIWNSKYFSHYQKIFLLVCILFPPAQWVLAIIIGLWNKFNDSTIGFKIDSANKSKQDLENFKYIGIISEKEYAEKSVQIYNKKLNELFLKSKEYKSLKRLKNKGVLTTSEFDEKLELLKNKMIEKVNKSDVSPINDTVTEHLTKPLTEQKKNDININVFIGLWENQESSINIFKSKSFAFYISTKYTPPVTGKWEYLDENNGVLIFKYEDNIINFSIKEEKEMVFKYNNENYILIKA